VTPAIERLQRLARRHPRLARAYAVGVDVIRAQSSERTSLSAAAVAFWSAIAVTPAFIAIAMIFGRLLDSQHLTEAVKALEAAAPDSLGTLLAGQLKAASQASTSQISWGIAIALVTVLWTVSTAVYTFQRAVRVAYGLDPQQYLSARVWAYVGSLTMVLLLGILLIAAGAGAAWASTLDEPWRAFAFTTGSLLALLLGTGVLVATFRAAAGGHAPRRNWPGAAAGAVGSFAVVIGFGIYLRFATGYQAIYGTLASTVILSLVLYIAAYVILLGAIGNAALARSSREPHGPPA
jgi:membrane protein